MRLALRLNKNCKYWNVNKLWPHCIHKSMNTHSIRSGGAVAEWVRESTGDRTVDGSSPTSVKTFLFGTLAIAFTPQKTVKAVGPFLLLWCLCQGK